MTGACVFFSLFRGVGGERSIVNESEGCAHEEKVLTLWYEENHIIIGGVPDVGLRCPVFDGQIYR